MKATEFRKLIREEVRKVIKEQKISDVVVSTMNYDFPISKLKRGFGSFLTIKQGPKTTANDFIYTADLDVDALVSLLKSNKDYQAFEADPQDNTISIFFKNDEVYISTKKLPQNVISAIEQAGVKNTQKSVVNIQIGNPEDNFEDYESFQLPKVIQSLVGSPKFSPSADDNQDVYSKEIGKYVRQIEKMLLAAGQKVVPGMKKYAAEDGEISFELPGKTTPQIKAKLMALYRGAKSVEVL